MKLPAITKIIVVSAVLTTFLQVPTVLASAPVGSFVCKSTFLDIEEDTELCYWVNFLDYNRVVKGYSDLTYRPENSVTRAEFAKFIVKAFGLDYATVNIPSQEDFDALPNEEKIFPDILPDNVFYQYIHALKEAEIIQGYTDGLYRPEEPVTRSAAQKYLTNAAQYQNDNLFIVQAELPFSDITDTHVFYPYVSRAYTATRDEPDYDQIISIEGSPEFYPDNNLSRGDLAKMVTNSMVYGGFAPGSPIPGLGEAIGGIKATKTFEDNGMKVYHYDDFGMTILTTNNVMEYNYIPNDAPTVQELSENVNYLYTINGGFFGGTHLDADHAGFLNYYGIHLTPMKGPEESQQLTHVVRFDKANNRLSIWDREGFLPYENSTKVVEFQTGPLVLRNDEIQSDYIFNSKNGRGKHKRTLMGISDTDGREKMFITVRDEMSLNEIAHILLHLELFEGKQITVVNLDGGSSSVLYSKNFPELNYGTEKRMPILIGIQD
ncbi:S-layer homology domain-containing protein [Candidatus Dojkabacteria bacterium]|uniref:S-layer homology domain-containing protein n=1 Tax=Candidatus Dojkabacteria bacterium TaxID=2099670 RepID=A0A955RJX1_9BACT|nr:S-layer homology domain-containing protein [Candidatus Dojkabacteria bacterium]